MRRIDITVECKDCGAKFVVTGGEQQFMFEKGLELPKRCPDCRKRRKEQRDGKK